MAKKQIHEFRKDLVSGDWILVVPSRARRPDIAKVSKNKKFCPFCDPQKSGNPFPTLWYPRPNTPLKKRKELSSWFVQVLPNKYPLVLPNLKKACPRIKFSGPEQTFNGIGFHEVIITRDHFKTIDKMDLEEIDLILKAYQMRYQILATEPCINYILIFHNQGKLAGASLSHPHSQLVALPVVDPDISKSLEGSQEYFKKHKKCIHCAMLEWEMKKKKRIIHQNKYFVTLEPFAPRVSYETRIYPTSHDGHFEKISEEKRWFFAESLKDVLKRMAKTLKNPGYNFFIHSAPPNSKNYNHYHWHLEILPRVSSWAGLELGVGIEAVIVSPEEAAKNLRRAL
jgi:UDPglucose--hexose-1-phosphate uridylyltransferase